LGKAEEVEEGWQVNQDFISPLPYVKVDKCIVPESVRWGGCSFFLLIT